MAPYHPSSNGLAERAVQTVKQALEHCLQGRSTSECLAGFLLTYRNTPHPTTGCVPAQLMFGRRLTCRFDLLFPSHGPEHHVLAEQQRQCLSHDRSARGRPELDVGRTVFVKDYTHRLVRWQKGVIVSRTGPVSFKVWMAEIGGVQRCHVDQLRACSLPVEGPLTPDLAEESADLEGEEETQESSPAESSLSMAEKASESLPMAEKASESVNPAQTESSSEHGANLSSLSRKTNTNRQMTPVDGTADGLNDRKEPCELRRSERIKRKPDRLIETC